ncbi:MAG: translation initiation factor IF-3 [Polyangiales bacterium]
MDPRDNRPPTTRVNHRIRVPEVRLIGADGSPIGVVATHEALKMAQESGLDLVEVNAKSDPPVCRILDFGKMKYEDKKKAAEAKRKQTVIEIKELKLRPKTDDHDLNVKITRARRFLEAGDKVKFTVRFKGREITHPERAQMQLDVIWKAVEELSVIEVTPRLDGRTMILQVAPKPAVLQRAAQLKIQQEKLRQQAANEGRELPPEPEEDAGDAGEDDDDDEDETAEAKA